jgi:hypothetical protein
MRIHTDGAELVKGTPQVGGVVYFEYKKIPHWAVITELRADGFMVMESNYKRCVTDTRLVRWDDPNIRNFLVPKDSS